LVYVALRARNGFGHGVDPRKHRTVRPVGFQSPHQVKRSCPAKVVSNDSKVVGVALQRVTEGRAVSDGRNVGVRPLVAKFAHDPGTVVGVVNDEQES
jgi:hypothetical protein